MLDLMTRARQLNRPGLLVRAARFQLDSYNRETILRRLLNCEEAPRSGLAMFHLLELEAALNENRTQNATEYDFMRHIAVLAAIMGEARIMMATTPHIVT